MKARKKSKRELKAMTLPELLIVLIVGGMLFIALFEGWNTVRWCSIDLYKKWEKGSLTFSGIERLETLFVISDSIIPVDQAVVFLRGDTVLGRLECSRQLLIFEWDGREEKGKDTLLRGVQAVVPVISIAGRSRQDSLYVTLKNENKSWYLGFGKRPLEEEERVRRFELLETGH